MHIVLVGLNHQSAPVELRERLAFRHDHLPEAFARLRQEVGIREAAILSTCNRVEIYAGVPELDGAVSRLHRFLSDHSRIALAELEQRLYSYTDPQSVRHLFAVASGLDSMVLGEAEILHQVKQAYELAQQHAVAGKVFHALFQRALNTAKTVRTQTAIGRGCTSIGTVAVELSQKIFGQLSGATVLLLGAGKIGELTLKHLAARGVRQVRVMNRSSERAAAVAAAYAAVPVGFEQLPQQLLDADVLISSTSAPSYLLHREQIASAMHARRQRPLCIVDLGVPRNIDPAAAPLENVYLFDIDDLQGLVEQHSRAREQAARQAGAIIDQKTEHFLSWFREEGDAQHPCDSHRDPRQLAGEVPGADRPGEAGRAVSGSVL